MRCKLFFLSILFVVIHSHAQQKQQSKTLFIQPAIGVQPWSLPLKAVGSVLLEYPIAGKLTLASHSSFGTAISKNRFDIKTDHSILLSQKFGAGITLADKRKWSRISLLLLGGIKYLAFKETLNHPDLETVSVTKRITMPDIGLVWGVSLGKGRYSWHARTYLPFYPLQGYPVSTYTSISFETGLRIRWNRK